MGVKNFVRKIADKAGNRVAKLSELSSYQVEEIQLAREEYLLEEPDPKDEAAVERTQRMMAASSIEIFNAYLPQIKDLYLPIEKDAEYASAFDALHNIRYINITKWVTDKKENSIEKLVNVYAVLSNEDCNIALVFNRTKKETNVYLAVVNTKNADNNVDANAYKHRIIEAIKGNFPGAEYRDDGIGQIPCMSKDRNYSVATASNIPTEKSEKFISQTIEKLLDGVIPDSGKTEYTIVLLATPILDVEERKLKLSEFYSGLAPYASWQTDFHFMDNKAFGSSATVGVNVGVSAGAQNGTNQAITENDSITNNEANTITDSQNRTLTKGVSNSETDSISHSDSRSAVDTETHGENLNVSASASLGVPGTGVQSGVSSGINSSVSSSIGKIAAETIAKGFTSTLSESASVTTGRAVANTLGKAVTKAMAATSGVAKATNLGANFGANFARSSTVTAMIGKTEGITQSFTNYNIKHALELLESQMKRLEQSTALGMWDFAAYVLSEDQDIANNVAHSYLALTLGEESYMSKSAINLWWGNVEEEKDAAKTICDYIRDLRHPMFALNLSVDEKNKDKSYYEYPPIVTATTSLSGKELAYSLNFPQKSVSGLSVLECAEFGRNVVTYEDIKPDEKKIRLGNVFHMHHEETTQINLSLESFKSHAFITGSTGAGKSNTIYHLLNSARDNDVNFLVIEPAKGEYKNIFGTDKDVEVYGTNPQMSPLLRINPFSFPEDIHVLEHMDRLVEIFNVCWPMYAAMPAVLKAAIEKSYADCGWDLITSKNSYGDDLYPNFSDVARNIKTIIDTSEYDAENKGAYKGSLLTRLHSLTNGINGMIFSCNDIADKELFDRNVIIDLSRVGSSETKSLIMGMLVLKLQEYRMTSTHGMNSNLKHITVLEEAHNLLKRTSSTITSESANLMGKSVEMLANAIAEMRTYGEGFIVADQAPGLLDLSVIRNTNTKIIMRLPDLGDRELVGKAANLNEDQISELAKLPCGVAAVYQNEWIQPMLCKIDRYGDDNKVYGYSGTDIYDFVKAQAEVSDSLLHCIMDKELLQIGDKQDLKELRYMIMKSGLDTCIKVDFLKYIEDTGADGIEKLRCLIYDFLNAKEAIETSTQFDDIHEWVESVLGNLNPTLRGYSKKQLDLTMALILQEQVIRDVSYKNIYHRFTEIYENGGGVF